MAHVVIKPNPKSGYHLLVDGTDIADSVLWDGFRVSPNPDTTVLEVSVTIVADELEADLPEVGVHVLQVEASHAE